MLNVARFEREMFAVDSRNIDSLTHDGHLLRDHDRSDVGHQKIMTKGGEMTKATNCGVRRDIQNILLI